MAAGTAAIKTEFIVQHAADCEPSAKKFKVDEQHNNAENGKKRGQNKNRYQKHNELSEPKLCISVLKSGNESSCSTPNCKYLHSTDEYLKLKPSDINSKCYVHETTGHCQWGVSCRFFSGHTAKVDESIHRETENELISKPVLTALRKKQYNFSRAEEAIALVTNEAKRDKMTPTDNDSEPKIIHDSACESGVNPREKRKIDFYGKLYLSPLTTLGNLPFRRICKEWGADITCGEMAMSSSILQGQPSELALLRRHHSEDIFGVQLCGNNPYTLARSAQLVEEIGAADFIDLNLGCPIDIVYQKGAGCGLLRREKLLANVIRSMVASTDLPVTLKTRTGIYDSKRVALNLMPLYSSTGVSLVTIHGRTREQRYSGPADWNYIDNCAGAAKPVPVFGNGDVLSYQDYKNAIDNCKNISGVMIGRGALYKPWIFKEIKEQRDWDISSSERLSILQKFVNYGFEHWGSDTRGVETTRRFLLEWLSFLYRYIPLGLLERPPQRINERPPKYCGRDDLETLMCSPNSSDWVKISIMLCGPVPENFHFTPKHKAKAWSD